MLTHASTHTIKKLSFHHKEHEQLNNSVKGVHEVMENLEKGGSDATGKSGMIPAKVLTMLTGPDGYQHEPSEKLSLPLIKKGLIIGTLLVNNFDFVNEVGNSDVSLILKQPGQRKPSLASFSYDSFAFWMATHKLASVHEDGFIAAAIKLVSLD
jgi:hypothetical protein